MQRAVAYYRVSSTLQTGERHVSLAVQAQRARAHCERHGYALVGEYQDVFTGRRDDRQQYQAMLAACRAGGISVCVVMFLDRFGRSMWEIVRQMLALRDIGVRIEATEQAIATGDTPEADLLFAITSWQAEQEPRRTAARVRPAIVRKLEAGEHWGPNIYGWRKDPETRKLMLYEPEAQTVRDMAHWLTAEGLSLRAIANRLNAAGIPARRAAYWTNGTVRALLRRPRNDGALTWGSAGTKNNRAGTKPAVALTVPPLWTAELGAAVRERLALLSALPRGRSPQAAHLLTGLMRCGLCGAPVSGGSTRSSAGNVTRWYRCSMQAQRAGCSFAYANAVRLEAAVVAALLTAADAAAATAAAARLAQPARDYAAEAAQAAGELARLEQTARRLYGQFRDGALSEAQFLLYNAQAKADLDAAAARVTATAAAQAADARARSRITALPTRARSLLAAWDASTTAQRKAALQDLVSRITVHPGGRVAVAFRE